MIDVKGMVFDIQRYSIHDGPGIRTIVFLKGCKLRCQWCCNPESFHQRRDLVWRSKKCIGCLECISICPEDAIRLSTNKKIQIDRERCTLCGKCADNCCSRALDFYGKEMFVEEVMQVIRKDLEFYKSSGGGVTLSGGEFSQQFEFSIELLKQCKREKIHTAVETTGFCEWSKLQKLLDQIDLVLYDLKIIDEKNHINFTGVSNKVILENLKMIDDLGKPFTIRIPVIPTVNNDKANVDQILKLLSGLKSKFSINLLPYHNYGLFKYKLLDIKYPLQGLQTPSVDELIQFRSYFGSTKYTINIGDE